MVTGIGPALSALQAFAKETRSHGPQCGQCEYPGFEKSTVLLQEAFPSGVTATVEQGRNAPGRFAAGKMELQNLGALQCRCRRGNGQPHYHPTRLYSQPQNNPDRARDTWDPPRHHRLISPDLRKNHTCFFYRLCSRMAEPLDPAQVFRRSGRLKWEEIKYEAGGIICVYVCT